MTKNKIGFYEGYKYYIETAARGRFIMRKRTPSSHAQVVCFDNRETIKRHCRFHPWLVDLLLFDYGERQTG